MYINQRHAGSICRPRATSLMNAGLISTFKKLKKNNLHQLGKPVGGQEIEQCQCQSYPLWTLSTLEW